MVTLKLRSAFTSLPAGVFCPGGLGGAADGVA